MEDAIIQEALNQFEKALNHLHQEYGKLQTGRASGALVENVEVENYGARMPLKSLANISVPDAKSIVIQPWDRGGLTNIEKAIRDADLGLNPKNDGVALYITLPPITEERRRELVKLVSSLAEEARISIRNARHHAIDQMKNLEKSKEISEDQRTGREKALQVRVDEYNKKVEESASHKEQDILTV